MSGNGHHLLTFVVWTNYFRWCFILEMDTLNDAEFQRLSENIKTILG
jgi:hypothetical protein